MRLKAEYESFVTRLQQFMELSVASVQGEDQARCSGEFDQLALELFRLQHATNDSYRRVCDSRGVDPNSFTSWKDLPALPSSAFKHYEITSIPELAREAVFYSSGTTAENRARHFHSRDSLRVYEASLWAWFRSHVLRREASPAPRFLTPSRAEAPHSSLVYMLEILCHRMGTPPGDSFLGKAGEEGEWRLDCEAVANALRSHWSQGIPVFLFGTAFSFVHLLDYLGEQLECIQLPAGSRVFETGGYKGKSRELSRPALHKAIRHRLGVPLDSIVCEYGMCELSSQAYSLAPREPRTFTFPPWARPLIISPETNAEARAGEVGLLRVVDLANVYSVAAVQTEDLAMSTGSGGGFNLLGRATASEIRGCSLLAENDSP